MERRMDGGSSLRMLQCAAPVLLAALLGWSAVGLAQSTDQTPATASAPAASTMPDAQVEANVLKALAGAPDLANQPMTTTTVYGVVTLSGSVETEAQRTEAETIASRTRGVKKVVDEMTLSGENANAQPPQNPGAVAGKRAVADRGGVAGLGQHGELRTRPRIPGWRTGLSTRYGSGTTGCVTAVRQQPYGAPPGYGQPQQGYARSSQCMADRKPASR